MDPATFVLQAGYGEEEVAREALSADASLAYATNDSGVSVIAATVYAGRLRFAREIAATRDDLDLFEAACIGDLDRTQAILEEDPKSIDRFAPDGFSAIGFAAFFGHIHLLGLLIDRGADFETPSQNPMRVRPLHSAAAHSHQEDATPLSRLLLAAGADPNVQQEAGMTPLHEAVYNGNEDLVELLLGHGADPHLRNEEGQSPLQQAQAEDKQSIASRLASAGDR